MTTYAVTAATGHLGSLAVTALIEAGVAPNQIVAVARNLDKAEHLRTQGVQVRQGDYTDLDSLSTALQGVDRVLLVSSPTVGQRTDQHRNVINAAEAAGVQRLAYTSLARANENSMPLAPEHRETEALLEASGLQTVILRNGWYLENFTESLPQYQAQGAIIGSAGEAKVSAATRREYAQAAAAALTAESNDKALYELGGPTFTMPELASEISAATGQDLPYRSVSLADFQAGLEQAGLDAETASFVAGMEAGVAAGDLEVPTTDLESLLGHPVASLADSVRAVL